MSPFGDTFPERNRTGVEKRSRKTRLDEAVKQQNGELINGRLFAKAGIAKTGSKANIRIRWWRLRRQSGRQEEVAAP